MKEIRVLSLFDGISCAQLALSNLGKNPQYLASEINEDAIAVTQRNFPNTTQLGDIRQIKKLPPVELLIGGSPCQGFSKAGERLNFLDERSSLFFEFVRILELTKPPYFLLENVMMKKEWQDVISSYLGVQSTPLNSSLLTCTLRSRLYWTNIPFEIPKDKGIVLGDVLEDDRDFPLFTLKEPPEFRPTYVKWGPHIQNRAYYKEGKMACLTEAGTRKLNIYLGSKDKTPHLYRRLSPIEAERCQGIPDGYTKYGGDELSAKKRFGLIGNGFTVPVVQHILKAI